MKGIRQAIPHDVYEYKRVPKNQHLYRKRYEVLMLNYNKNLEGIKTLELTKYLN
jgi:hypothetical protein